MFKALRAEHLPSARAALSAWYTGQYWQWGWLNIATFREMHPYRLAEVKQIISFSPPCCISFLRQPTGDWKIPKLLNCLFRTDMSQSWSWLCKRSWTLDLLVKQDSDPGHPVFVSAKPNIRQWFSPKQPECFYVYFISTFWFPALHPAHITSFPSSSCQSLLHISNI